MAAGFGCIEIGSITVDLEDPFTGMIAHSSIWMGCTIVKEVEHGFLWSNGALGLLTGQIIDGIHHGWIHSSGIKQEGATDLLECFCCWGVMGGSLEGSAAYWMQLSYVGASQGAGLCTGCLGWGWWKHWRAFLTYPGMDKSTVQLLLSHVSLIPQ